MTYELAKQLKDAGFPQPQVGHFKAANGEGRGAPAVLMENGLQDPCYHPTLSELIEACGMNFVDLQNTDVFGNHHWTAHSNDQIRIFIGIGSTPEEAVAKLWLALHPKL